MPTVPAHNLDSRELRRWLPSAFSVRAFLGLLFLAYVSLPGQMAHGLLSQAGAQAVVVLYLATLALLHLRHRRRPLTQGLPTLLLLIDMPLLPLILAGDMFQSMPSQLVLLVLLIDQGARFGLKPYERSLAAGLAVLGAAVVLRVLLIPTGIAVSAVWVSLFLVGAWIYLWMMMRGRELLDQALARQQEDLRLSEERFAKSFEHASIGMALVSPRGQWLKVNRAVTQITGYSHEELLAGTFQDITHPDDVANDIELAQQVLSGQVQNYHLEKRYLHKDGRTIWVLLSVSLVRDEQGKPLHFVSQIQDITQRRRAEEMLRVARDEALAGLEARSEFLANMSHEIRTPMNAVIGMNEKLLDMPLAPLQREVAERVRYSAQSLLTVINDILDFSKGEAGALQLDVAQIDLRRVVEGAMGMVAEPIQDKRLELALLFDPAIPAGLHGDAGRIHQVLTNLLSNALKFTHHGEIVVEARLLRISGDEASVRMSVRDTGIGVPEVARAKLFQPFTQADSSTTRKYGGTGLGLSISKRIVELMGGEVGVDSIVEEGSTFWFTMRLGHDAQAQAPDRSQLRGRRILVADDHAVTRRGLLADLRSWGVQADETDSGASALAWLQQSPSGHYDAVILDSTMADLPGALLAARIRADAAFLRTRILLLRPVQVADDTAMRAAGADAVIPKPVREATLYHSLLTLTGQVTPSLARVVTAAPQMSVAEVRQHGWRVLVAEDNELNREVVLHQLEKLGLEPQVVTNGREALEALSRKEFDLLFLDCQMPLLDGYATARVVREREPLNRHLHIVAMTAHAMQGDRERCLAAGMDDYLPKPISVEMLRAALERFAQARAGREPTLAAAPIPDAASQSLDASRLNEVARGDAQKLRKLAEMYIRLTGELLSQLRQALAERSAAEIQRLAHEGKGSSGIAGMHGMSTLFLRLEETARAGELDRVAQLLDDTDAQFQQTRSFLRGVAGATPASTGPAPGGRTVH